MTTKHYRKVGASIISCIALVAIERSASAASANASAPVRMPELRAAAHITRDHWGMAHISAQNEHDLFFLQGYVHAQDRLFQMDVSRRIASGTLAESVGEAALAQDVQLRTIGLHRAAERSLDVQSLRVRTALNGFAQGVNSFVRSHRLPPEYGALGLTRFEPWTPAHSLAVARLIAFQRSFDIDIEPTITLLTYQQAGQLLGFNGAALYFEDLFRSAPFDPTITLSGASDASPSMIGGNIPTMGMSAEISLMRRNQVSAALGARFSPETLQLCAEYMDRIKDLPVFRDTLDRDKHAGSNEWGISGEHTTTGFPMLANDTHLPLGVPNLFYPMHLSAGTINVGGSSVAGVPFIILGQNENISWGDRAIIL